MFGKKHYIYLNENEFRVLVQSLIRMKNTLIQQNRCTDCVDELIVKVLNAPLKRVRV